MAYDEYDGAAEHEAAHERAGKVREHSIRRKRIRRRRTSTERELAHMFLGKVCFLQQNYM